MDCTYVYNVSKTTKSLLGFRNYLKLDKISITLIRNRQVLRCFVSNIAHKDYSDNMESFKLLKPFCDFIPHTLEEVSE